MADLEKREQEYADKDKNVAYLKSVVQEIMEDEEWELPKEARFFYMGKYPWDLLFL